MSWLWRGDVNSPASFEKALSKLAQQIAAANLALDTSRSRARRIKALWTLYTTLAYLVFLLIVFLVLGPSNWAVPHYAGVIGAPLVIFGIRRLITLFFDWRLAGQQSYLSQLQKQRDEKIADLKKATKYDSTQELLQKYDAAPPKQNPALSQPQQGNKRKVGQPPQQVQRTGLPPPPTANIAVRNPVQPVTPQRSDATASFPDGATPFGSPQLQSPGSVQLSPGTPGFAPDALSIAPSSAPPTYSQPAQWYDRILDVLLGEDETAAKNRFALICSNCRLVNGQAPPGTKTLEEVGRWRCSSCGTMNGEQSEVKKVLQQAKDAKADENEGWQKVPRGHHLDGEDEDADEAVEAETTESVEIQDSKLTTTTARHDALEDSGVSRRITRSAQKGGQLKSSE